MKKRITLSDIARIGGVSRGTVDRALHNRSRIRNETKDKILAKVKELGYKPNILARGLKLRRSFLIGIVIPDITTSFYPQIVKGVENVTDQFNYNIILRTCCSKEEIEKSILLLQDKDVDGIIVSHDFDKYLPVYKKIRNAEIPVVFINFRVKGIKGPYVLLDNRLGAFLATSHLITQGYQKIGCVCTRVDNYVNRERVMGYQQALQDHNINFDEGLIFRNEMDSESVYQNMKNVLLNLEKPIAFFATTDFAGIGIIQAALGCELKVPDDVGVVGFDDLPLTTIIKPSLSSISQPKEEIGEKAAFKLFKMLEGEKVANEILKPTLVVRESSRKEES